MTLVDVLGTTTYGGIFINYKAKHLNNFAINIGVGNTFLAEMV